MIDYFEEPKKPLVRTAKFARGAFFLKGTLPFIFLLVGNSSSTRPPGVEAAAVLKPWSEVPRCWWAPFGTIAENDFDVAASWYKPGVGEKAPDADPGLLIREMLRIEREIAARLEKLLKEIEA